MLCIARTLLNPAPLLLCDEITSNLDTESDEYISKMILDLDRSKITILSIVHRTKFIHLYDRVLVMDQGKIVLDGSPNDSSIKEYLDFQNFSSL